MITDAQSEGDPIAALHLEVLFDSGHLGNIGDKNNLVTYAAPSIHCPNEYDVGHMRHRLVFMGVSTDLTKAESIEKGNTAISRSAVDIAAWRTYLPEDCVVRTIKDSWPRSS
jgi:hypothetical protein